MRRSAALLLTLLLPSPVQAQERVLAHMNFAVYAAALHVVDIDSNADLEADRYRLDLAYHSVGLFGTMVHEDVQSFALGGWNGARPLPQRFANWGFVRGRNRRTTIDYPRGQPVISLQEPPQEEDRDPVPPGLQRDTIDTLSAMAMLVRQVARTGNCEGQATTFDGHRVLAVTSHTGGQEMLAPSGRSSFSGQTLRCDVEGRQLAGFQHDETEAQAHRIHYSTAWLARVLPGQPPLPVRVDFEARIVGQATAYLTAVTPGQPVQ